MDVSPVVVAVAIESLLLLSESVSFSIRQFLKTRLSLLIVSAIVVSSSLLIVVSTVVVPSSLLIVVSAVVVPSSLLIVVPSSGVRSFPELADSWRVAVRDVFSSLGVVPVAGVRSS